MKKIIAFITTITVLTLFGCDEMQSNSYIYTNNPQNYTVKTETAYLEIQDFVVPDWAVDYPSIIKEYQRFAGCLMNDETEYNGNKSADANNIFQTPDGKLNYSWGCMRAETYRWFVMHSTKSREDFGYALEDLNNDGNNELILLLEDYTVIALFTMTNGTPKLLDAFWPRNRCAINKDRLIYTLSSGGADDWEYTAKRISENSSELIPVEGYGSSSGGGHPYYYHKVDGEMQIINEAELSEIRERIPIFSDTTANQITKSSGIKFIPLFS